jgi:hypothetical protein
MQIPAETFAPAVENRQMRPPLAEPLFQVHEAKALSEPVAVVSAAVLSEARTQPQTTAPQSIDVKTLVRSALGLRGAIIVREILGPPRGLREFELP